MQRAVRRLLRELPYREMRQLSHEVANKMGVDPHNETVIADALSSVPTDAEYDEAARRRRAILAEFFHRKKQITIQPEGNGYMFVIPAVGISVVSDDIEEGLQTLLETLISHEALK